MTYVNDLQATNSVPEGLNGKPYCPLSLPPFQRLNKLPQHLIGAALAPAHHRVLPEIIGDLCSACPCIDHRDIEVGVGSFGKRSRRGNLVADDIIGFFVFKNLHRYQPEIVDLISRVERSDRRHPDGHIAADAVVGNDGKPFEGQLVLQLAEDQVVGIHRYYLECAFGIEIIRFVKRLTGNTNA